MKGHGPCKISVCQRTLALLTFKGLAGERGEAAADEWETVEGKVAGTGKCQTWWAAHPAVEAIKLEGKTRAKRKSHHCIVAGVLITKGSELTVEIARLWLIKVAADRHHCVLQMLGVPHFQKGNWEMSATPIVSCTSEQRSTLISHLCFHTL